eukprot:3815278-Pleurochrysis_carterae.AAC.1
MAARLVAIDLQLRSNSYRSLSPQSTKPRNTLRPDEPSPAGHSVPAQQRHAASAKALTPRASDRAERAEGSQEVGEGFRG